MAKVPESNGTTDGVAEARSRELNTEFQTDIWALFAKYQQAEDILDPTKFYQTVALSMLSCAAVTAVDVGITDTQFVGMAKTLWDDTFKRAPKFS